MSIKGSPYARFERALAIGNPALIRGAAAELPKLTLGDALRVTLVLQRSEPALGDRAAVRWLARLALEVPALSLLDLQLAATALAAVARGREAAGIRALQALAEACGRRDIIAALEQALPG
jgi:hypothetical protein